MAKPEGPQAPPIPERAQDSAASQVLQAPQQPTPHMPPLNWSYFMPKFSGKPDKDTEHLLKTKDWMDIHKILGR